MDLNPEYVDAALVRFSRRFASLELFVGDLELDEIAFSPADLVFAGLVLEYVDVDAVLRRIRLMLRPLGILVTVVHLPSDSLPEVSPSRFASLEALASVMRLVSPDKLQRLAGTHGYNQIDCQLVEVPGGKSFQIQAFQVMTFNYPLPPTPA